MRISIIKKLVKNFSIKKGEDFKKPKKFLMIRKCVNMVPGMAWPGMNNIMNEKIIGLLEIDVFGVFDAMTSVKRGHFKRK